MRLKISDIQRLQRAGKIKGYKEVGPKRTKKAKGARKKVDPPGLSFIKRVLESEGISYSTEYKFHPVRMFRFDIAVPDMMLAIEYEGLVSTGKKGGHQTKKHYTKDCTKYNLAQSLGWKVYRYTVRNYKEFVNDLKTML